MAPRAQDGGGSTGQRDEFVDESPLVHKVTVPPRGGVVKEVSHGLYEMFLYDAPVDQFRGQSKRKKSWLGIQYVFPILGWISSYTPRLFASDLVAGLTIASLAVPQVGARLVLAIPSSFLASYVLEFEFSIATLQPARSPIVSVVAGYRVCGTCRIAGSAWAL